MFLCSWEQRYRRCVYGHINTHTKMNACRESDVAVWFTLRSFVFLYSSCSFSLSSRLSSCIFHLNGVVPLFLFYNSKEQWIKNYRKQQREREREREMKLYLNYLEKRKKKKKKTQEKKIQLRIFSFWNINRATLLHTFYLHIRNNILAHPNNISPSLHFVSLLFFDYLFLSCLLCHQHFY